MKTAVNTKGEMIEAAEQAPETAVCPHCGNPVALRRRKDMSGETTYFWRHRRGFNLTCRKRASPISRKVNRINHL